MRTHALRPSRRHVGSRCGGCRGPGSAGRRGSGVCGLAACCLPLGLDRRGASYSARHPATAFRRRRGAGSSAGHPSASGTGRPRAASAAGRCSRRAGCPGPAWPGQHLQGGGGLPAAAARGSGRTAAPAAPPPAPPPAGAAAAPAAPGGAAAGRSAADHVGQFGAPGRRSARRRGRQGSAAPGPERHPSADVRPDRADPAGRLRPPRHPRSACRRRKRSPRRTTSAAAATPPGRCGLRASPCRRGFWRSRACGSTCSRRHSNRAARRCASPRSPPP